MVEDLLIHDEFLEGLMDRVRYTNCYTEHRRKVDNDKGQDKAILRNRGYWGRPDIREGNAKILEDRSTTNRRMDGGRYNE